MPQGWGDLLYSPHARGADSTMTTAIALFTRDLRRHDNPMLAAAAASSEFVVPLFVHDEAIMTGRFSAAARARFLAEALADLDAGLRAVGSGLVVQRGPVVEEVCRIARQVNATEVHISADVSGYAQRRQSRLAAALAGERRGLRCYHEVIPIVGPGRILPAGAGRDHFAVFTPYFRRWQATARRPLANPGARLRLPPEIDPPPTTVETEHSSGPWPGGETEARRRADRWFDGALENYDQRHDDLAGDATSRLSPYLHFGCLSPAVLAARAEDRPGVGAAAFVRQLAWRDFYHQVLAARPAATHDDYRPRGDRWRDDDQALDAWRQGRTGIPLVDAGMRQLLAEGWMHNRARLVVASFLTKTLYLDWRAGASHFFQHLLDGDVANNCLNWQWAAGTGTDTRPNRVLNPLRQAERYDQDGGYVRRWIPELDGLPTADIHQPWRLGLAELHRRGYPAPIVDLHGARDRFLQARRFRPEV